MECGDASGTGLFDIRSRSWSEKAIQAIDAEHLPQVLPKVIEANAIVGKLQKHLALIWNLNEDVVVSAGGGDNMMGAIGTGNVEPGIVTASFGTSGTIYAFSENPVVDKQSMVAGFCDSTGYWLPLVCVLNATGATEVVRNQFKLSHIEFDEAVESIKPGADGLLLLPYLEGERTPNYPEATGVFFGMRQETFDASHMARAAMEGVTLGMNFGLNQLRRLGLNPLEIRVTGGGSKSKVWRQIMADIFAVPVVTMMSEEGAAYGAAIQSIWAYQSQNGSNVTIKSLCDKYINVDESSRLLPSKNNRLIYQKLQALHDQLSQALGPSFSIHRDILKELDQELAVCS
jgi:sugar (pentulose or hexulose) kinase